MTGRRERERTSAQASLLDRLVDLNPTDATDQNVSYTDSLAALREAVRRDLEALLNTRRAALEWPAQLRELGRSVVSYGVGDVSGQHMSDTTERERFRASVELAIRTFEPRFQSFSVTLDGGNDEINRKLGLRIEALMHADPVPQSLIFNSVVEPSTQHFRVAEAR